MKLHSRYLFILLIIAFSPALLKAQQSSLLNKANVLFQNKAYSTAIPKYINYLKKDSLNFEAVFNLADCYRLTNDTYHAEKWYHKAVRFQESLPIHQLYLAQALMANSNLNEAKKWLVNYSKNTLDDMRAREALDFIDKLDIYFETASDVQVKKININSKEDDFSPAFYKKGIVFTSSRRKMAIVKNNDTWTGNNFYSIYYAELKDSNIFHKPVLFEPDLQGNANNGPVCISKDGKTMFFTRNSTDAKSSEGFIKLEIYEVKLSANGKNWDKNYIPFRWNSNSYNCTHPWLSPDGSKLYFASDMKLGYGGMDIYYCKREGNSWSEPQNLGSQVNTKGNEEFPYIDDSGILYFSSDGHGGFGGLDIVSCNPAGNSFEKPENMGIPINSNSDDFGLVLNGNAGYFSSNRENKGIDDDIYSLKINIPATVKVKIKIMGISAKVLSNADVKIEIKNSKKKIAVKKEMEELTAELQVGGEYVFDVEANNYITQKIIKKITSKTTEILVVLSPKEDRVYGDKKSNVGLKICIKGFVYSLNNGIKSGLPNTSVSIIEASSGKKRTETMTDNEGGVKICDLERDKKYIAKFNLPDYFINSVEIFTSNITADTIEENIHLNKINVGKPNKIEKVNFDSAGGHLSTESEKELEKIVKLMRDNPTIVIELSSHTDCRGIAQVSFDLSNKRAQLLKDFFLGRNIDSKRLFSSGYGATIPVNKCDCEKLNVTPCTEEQFRENERSEFKVIGFLRNGIIYSE